MNDDVNAMLKFMLSAFDFNKIAFITAHKTRILRQMLIKTAGAQKTEVSEEHLKAAGDAV